MVSVSYTHLDVYKRQDDSLRKAHEANEKLFSIQKEGESVMQQAREQQALLLKEATATRDAIVEKAQDKAHEESSRIDVYKRQKWVFDRRYDLCARI